MNSNAEIINNKSSKYIKFDGLFFKPELYKTLSLQFSVFSELKRRKCNK
jgi:hypothetical protein